MRKEQPAPFHQLRGLVSTVGCPSGVRVGAPAARAQKMAETLGRGGGEKILSPGIFIGVIALLPRIDATALLRLF